MKKIFYFLIFVVVLMLFAVSCRTKEVCPAYGNVSIETKPLHS